MILTQLPPVPATTEDRVGYPAPTAIYKAMLDAGASWIKPTEKLFPKRLRARVVKRNQREDWVCRLKLALFDNGEVVWGYNAEPCKEKLNRDSYLRHLLEYHLAVERGSNRKGQVSESLSRMPLAIANNNLNFNREGTFALHSSICERLPREEEAGRGGRRRRRRTRTS
jgi:hypothetical protein